MSNNENQTLLNAGQELAGIRHVEGTPFVVVPEGSDVHDLSEHLLAPVRPKGRSEFYDAESFVERVNELKTVETRLYGTLKPHPAFTAVFNDNTAIHAGHGDHLAVYNAPLSIEWKTWTGQDGNGFSQGDFAAFVEKNLPDVVDPVAADFLEISRTLEAKKAVNFKSAIRLSDGKNEFTYEEDIKGTAANGRLAIPETFAIGIPVLEGGPLYRVDARLRYRIKDGKLVLWYELVRPHKVLEDAAKEVRTLIAEQTNLFVFNGRP